MYPHLQNFLFSFRCAFYSCLRGLSSPETSRQGNLFGILGMIIAITVTFLSIDFSTGLFLLIFILAGSIGRLLLINTNDSYAWISCGFHSLVGLAAVFCISAFLNPSIQSWNTRIYKTWKFDWNVIGAAVGAITFSGSVIAFLKLQE